MFGLIDDRFDAKSKKKNRWDTGVAVALEAGAIKAVMEVKEEDKIDEDESETVEIQGTYLIAGPSFRFYSRNPDILFYSFGAELLFGTTDNEEVGLLSLGRFSFLFGKDNFHGGFHLGAMHLDVKSEDGFVRSGQKYNIISGFEFGYQF